MHYKYHDDIFHRNDQCLIFNVLILLFCVIDVTFSFFCVIFTHIPTPVLGGGGFIFYDYCSLLKKN